MQQFHCILKFLCLIIFSFLGQVLKIHFLKVNLNSLQILEYLVENTQIWVQRSDDM